MRNCQNPALRVLQPQQRAEKVSPSYNQGLQNSYLLFYMHYHSICDLGLAIVMLVVSQADVSD